jgi:hypothetical protein
MESAETQLVRSVLTVSIGDGSLRYRRRKKSTTTRLVLCHCAAQRDYLVHKVDTFIRPHLKSNAGIRDYNASVAKGLPAKYPTARIEFENIRLTPAYNLLYPKGYKEISHPVLSLLGLPAIATLYMDDGCRSGSQASICMNSHSDDEIHMTMDWIQAMTGVESYLYKYPQIYSGYNLRGKDIKFTADNTKRFLDAIREYAAPGMEYKFDY